MSRRGYSHSPYWKAKKAPRPDSYVAELLGLYSSHDRKMSRSASYRMGNPYCYVNKGLDSGVEIAMLTVAIMLDIGNAMKYEVMRLSDPLQRDIMKRELMIELKRLRRPFYYRQENERRRALAAARRKIRRRTTLSPMPTPEHVLCAWKHRKDSKEAMIRLGGLLQDLECYVDNRLRLGEDGIVRGRNGGIRGWLRDNLPELMPKYKTLMRYKAMAIALRQATGTKDPCPTERLLQKPYHPVVEAILSEKKDTFAIVLYIIDRAIAPERIFDG
jgi:hypothetical protein